MLQVVATQPPDCDPLGTILIGKEYPSTKLTSYQESWLGGWGGKLNSTLVSAGGWHPPAGHGGTESPNSQLYPLLSHPVFGQNRPAQPLVGIWNCASFHFSFSSYVWGLKCFECQPIFDYLWRKLTCYSLIRFHYYLMHKMKPTWYV